MRSPWIDLLFLHGHVIPTKLAWRPDAPVCECQSQQNVEVDIADLPLRTCRQNGESPCCA